MSRLKRGQTWQPTRLYGLTLAHAQAESGSFRGLNRCKQVCARGVVPAWVQPTGAHDAYALGAQVTHNGQVRQSTVNANVWQPGVYGWVVVS